MECFFANTQIHEYSLIGMIIEFDCSSFGSVLKNLLKNIEIKSICPFYLEHSTYEKTSDPIRSDNRNFFLQSTIASW